jgi:ssDNA-binding Zn-finger/Zn-ribbon topoisomerase 1
MTSRQQFSPLCDLHHVSMRRVMLEEESEEVRSYHACQRRDCTRVFRDSNGYSDWTDGRFDDSRVSLRTCPQCGAVLYLAEVRRSQKVETWECPQSECSFSEECTSPSGR